MQTSRPLVSVVTPLYNCEEYLADCIESVLGQTYDNWEYVIVDNCSTDRSFEIASGYAARDDRIRLIKATEFVGAEANHNRSIRLISAEARYCKFVFSDDWLFPNCVEEMVKLAEANPSVAIVGAYGTDGCNVLWTGLRGRRFDIPPPASRDVVNGREACRNKLLGKPYVFGNTGSQLIRCDEIRKRPVFFNEQNIHADQEVCLDILQDTDFGFVHQILTYSRRREQSESSFARDYNSIILGDFVIFLRFGPVFLSAGEYQSRLLELSWEYHRTLGRNVLRMRARDFWDYHRKTLAVFGGAIDYSQLARATAYEFGAGLLQPRAALGRAWRWWSSAWRRLRRS